MGVNSFQQSIIYKSSKADSLLNFLNIEAEVKKNLVNRFTNINTGEIDAYGLEQYLDAYRVATKDWDMFLYRKKMEEETFILFTKIEINCDITKNHLSFSLPEYGYPKNKKEETYVNYYLVEQYKEFLMTGKPVWGELKLAYSEGLLQLCGFTPLKTYSCEKSFLNEYKEARNSFSTEDWIDLLLTSFGFNPDSFESQEKKIYLIQRFAPLVEKRLNMIELTKKGNSKSYSYSLSNNQKLVTSGITRSNAFYNVSTKKEGFFFDNDMIAFDEIQSLRFTEDLFSLLKTYLENGQISIGNFTGISDAGLVLVGNQKENGLSLFRNLDPKVQESAFIDRFNCLIQGSKIDRMTEDKKYEGQTLDVDYVMEMFHMLREDFYFRSILDEILEVEDKADMRNLEAVKKNCCAMMKIIFPNIKRKEDINKEEFIKYCLNPAIEGRQGILEELRKIDNQYYKVEMPKIKLKIN